MGGKQLLLAACLLCLFDSGRAQALFPTSPVPVVTSKAFIEWVPKYVDACVASTPLPRSTTLHFSPDGSDTLGDGSIGRPYKTLAKANEVIAQSSGNLRLRFRDGAVFRSDLGVVIDKPQVTLDSYRKQSDSKSARKPILTRFEQPVPSAAWIPTLFPGTFQTNVSEPVAWAKYTGDETIVFRRMTSLGDCGATPGSWYWEPGRLYVHTFDNHSLIDTDRSIEYVLKNTESGIWVKDQESVRLHNLRIEGFGAGTPGDHSYPGYGIRYDGTETNRCVVTECETYYNGRHSMTKVASGFGGSLVLVRCKSGWLVNDGINVVGYSPLGGQELVTAYCEYLGSDLPSTNKPFPYAGSSTPVYLHTSNDALYTQAFFLSYRDRIVPGQYQCGDLHSSSCAPAFSDLKDAKSFVVGLTAPARSRTALDETKPSSNNGNGLLYKRLGGPNTVYINCEVSPTSLWSQAPGDVSLLTSSAGIWINCDLTFDFSALEQGNRDRVLSLSAVSPNFTQFQSSFYGCHLRFLGTGGGGVIGFSGPMLHRYGSHYNSFGARWRGRIAGSIVEGSGIGSGRFLVGFGNDTNLLQGNAYYGLSEESGAFGADQDMARVQGSNVFGRPHPDSELPGSKPILVGGRRLEYDKSERQRPTRPTIGPEESTTGQ